MQRILRTLQSTHIIFAAILLFGLLAMTARPATDPDLWWHLRSGQWIVETGHVPHSDPFSFTRAGHAWVSHEWLSEVVFYELWKHGGAAALIVFLWSTEALGCRSDRLRRPGVGSLLGRAAADVHLYPGQPTSMAARERQ